MTARPENQELRRFRIGADFHTLDGIFQGSRSHLLGIYSALLPKMADTDFCFFLADPRGLADTHPAFRAENVKLIRMEERGSIARFAWQLPALVRAHRLDLLHTQYRVPLFCAERCVCTIHDALFEDLPEFFPWLFRLQAAITFRWAARTARHVCTVSEFSRRAIAKHYGKPEGEISVTPNGVDAARFYPGVEGREAVAALGLEPGAYLLSVGRLEPRKNHVGLIRAYAGLTRPRPPLVIAGQRDFGFAGVFAAQRELALKDDLKILDSVDDSSLPALYRNARLFIYPSFGEGFGIPVLEAMASGIPVITSNTTSLPEIVGESARLVDPGSIESIRQAIEAALLDGEGRQAMAVRGLQQARGYTWERAADALAAVYRQLLKEFPAGAS